MPDLFPTLPDVRTEADSIKNPAFRGAFMKGVRAYKELGNEAVNPYKMIYQNDGGGTFAMAFRNHWEKGVKAYKRSLKKLEYRFIKPERK
jgi:hypothetical protein